MEWMSEHDLVCHTPPNTVTCHTVRSSRGTTIDLTFGNVEVTDFRLWDWHSRIDHFAITYSLTSNDPDGAARPPPPFSLAGLQWDHFSTTLHRRILEAPTTVPSADPWEMLQHSLRDTLAELRSLRSTESGTRRRNRRHRLKRKAWAWTPQCEVAVRERTRTYKHLKSTLPIVNDGRSRTAQIKQHPVYRRAHRTFCRARRAAKDSSAMAMLGNMTSATDWRRFEILLQRRSHLTCASPPLQNEDGSLSSTADQKCATFAEHFFPSASPAPTPERPRNYGEVLHFVHSLNPALPPIQGPRSPPSPSSCPNNGTEGGGRHGG